MDATRRLLLLALSATPAIALARRWPASGSPGTFEAEVRRLEGASGGRLGVALFDSGSGDRFAYRGDERFPMCSTFKLLLAAAVLRRTEQGKESLSRRIAVRPGALVSWSPFTEKRMGGEASVEELCAAAMTLSDNTAANLLLATIGGPAGIGAFARTLGDESTRLDRMETALNSATPGDLRDTTTPLAMLGNLRELLLGDEGYRTLQAASGMEAMDQIALESPQLILLDVSMPDMDGYAVATLLKADPKTNGIPIIMVTAHTGRGARVVGLHTGVEDYLTKPVDAPELLLKVRNLLRLRQNAELSAIREA
jgi:beta-lactamase class A